jgi:hypothetical protein
MSVSFFFFVSLITNATTTTKMANISFHSEQETIFPGLNTVSRKLAMPVLESSWALPVPDLFFW